MIRFDEDKHNRDIQSHPSWCLVKSSAPIDIYGPERKGYMRNVDGREPVYKAPAFNLGIIYDGGYRYRGTVL